MSEVVVRAENLSKRYRIVRAQCRPALREKLNRALTAPLRLFSPSSKERFWALKDLSFEVRQGEVAGLIGRNGSGKTTLLRILSRITPPTSGRAEVRGRLGSLLEVGTGFHTDLTGRENVYLSGAILGMNRQEIARKFDAIVAFAEVEKFIDTPLKHFSTGMQMRLAFAVAAHLEPDILLVDEVLAVGDLKFQKKCLGKMSEVSGSGRTIIFVSHQMNQIRRLCERVVWLDAGQLVSSGPTSEVVGRYEAAMGSGEWMGPGGAEAPKIKGRFHSWRILEPRGENPYALETLGPVTFAFDLEVRKPLRMCHHGISLYDSNGLLVWGNAVDNLDLEPGRHQFVYALPGLPLRPGPYSWRLSLYDEGGTGLVDVCHCVPEMLVTTEPLTHRMDEWAGVLNTPSTFSVQQNDHCPVSSK